MPIRVVATSGAPDLPVAFYTSTYGINAVLAVLMLLIGYAMWAGLGEDEVPTWPAWASWGAAVYCAAVAMLSKQFRRPYVVVDASEIRVHDVDGEHAAAWINVSAIREVRNGLELELKSGKTIRIRYFDLLHRDIRRLSRLVDQLARPRDGRRV